MTQEDKELLLKDLCARLPYGVKFKSEYDENLQEIHYIIDEEIYTRTYPHSPYWVETVKPYLRSMSSMTEEEKRTYTSLRAHAAPFTIVNWLDENHFDHRTNTEGEHLIELGIALEAPEGMYKNK